MRIKLLTLFDEAASSLRMESTPRPRNRCLDQNNAVLELKIEAI